MPTQRYSDQQVPSNRYTSKFFAQAFCFKKLVVPEPAQLRVIRVLLSLRTNSPTVSRMSGIGISRNRLSFIRLCGKMKIPEN